MNEENIGNYLFKIHRVYFFVLCWKVCYNKKQSGRRSRPHRVKRGNTAAKAAEAFYCNIAISGFAGDMPLGGTHPKCYIVSRSYECRHLQNI